MNSTNHAGESISGEKDLSVTNQKRRILLVENEPYLQQTLVQALNVALSGNVDVQVCNTPEAALSLSKIREYDMLITEHSLPRITGAELISKIRNDHPDLPAILLSNYSADTMSTNTLTMVDGFITKPFELTKLFKVVQRILATSASNNRITTELPSAASNGGTAPKPNNTNGHSESTISEEATETEPKPHRILIVEDDTGLLFIYRKTLTKAGYEIDLASNIAEGKSYIESGNYDIMICDIQLGKERGTDLVEQYGEELAEKGTQIIMVSSFGQYRHITKDLGVEFFLEKPISLSTLLTMIERLINRPKLQVAAVSTEEQLNY